MQIALLRAVNVGGQGKVAMEDLRALMKTLGLEDGKTLLQSGNLVFRGGGSGAALERRLEAEVKKHLGLETDFFVRDATAWTALVEGNPFPNEAREDPGHLVAMFLKAPVADARIATLQAAIVGREVVRGRRGGGSAAQREVYISYPDGIGRSRLTNTLIEKKLGTRSTGRNWNTVLKLWALAEA
jgi:uncharacterized protein (DUF1697 family)